MLPTEPLNSSVADLATRHLQHKSIALPPNLSLANVERAIAAGGVGLDHTIGERVFAFGDALDQLDLKVFFLLTDRRLAGRQHLVALTSARISRFQAKLSDIQQVKWKSTLMRKDLQIQAGVNWIDATISKFTEHLGKFLDDLVRIPPERREPPRQPLLIQSQGDASGLVSAMNRISDPHCVSLLQIINKKHQRGLFELQTAADMTARVVLLDRTLRSGRGMCEGWWLSPLSTADLVPRFFAMFGQPSAYSPQGALHAFDFDLVTDRGVGKAVASTAVGLAALGLLGVGWVSTPGSRPVTRLRVLMRDTPFSASFTIAGTNNGSLMQPLSDLAPNLLEKVLSILSESEAQLMLGRCVYGWEDPPSQLAARSLDEINQKLCDLDRP